MTAQLQEQAREIASLNLQVQGQEKTLNDLRGAFSSSSLDVYLLKGENDRLQQCIAALKAELTDTRVQLENANAQLGIATRVLPGIPEDIQEARLTRTDQESAGFMKPLLSQNSARPSLSSAQQPFQHKQVTGPHQPGRPIRGFDPTLVNRSSQSKQSSVQEGRGQPEKPVVKPEQDFQLMEKNKAATVPPNIYLDITHAAGTKNPFANLWSDPGSEVRQENTKEKKAEGKLREAEEKSKMAAKLPALDPNLPPREKLEILLERSLYIEANPHPASSDQRQSSVGTFGQIAPSQPRFIQGAMDRDACDTIAGSYDQYDGEDPALSPTARGGEFTYTRRDQPQPKVSLDCSESADTVKLKRRAMGIVDEGGARETKRQKKDEEE